MFRCIAASTVLALSAFGALGGPNKDAGVLVDHDANTVTIETAAAGASGSEVVMAIKVRDAVDLDGFAVELAYDTAVLEYVRASATTGAAGNFLTSSGGEMGPFLVQDEGGRVSIAGSIVGKEREKAPEGSGVIAYVVFTKLDGENAVVSVRTATLVDPELTTDSVKE